MRAGLLLCALALASPASADSAETQALQHLDRGIDAFRASSFVTARREFETARQLAPGKANAYRWLGLTAVQLGDCTRAIIDFDIFLRHVPADDERVAEVHRLRSTCLAQTSPPPAPAPAPRPSPLHKKWWFWTALAGGATAITLSVSLGVTLGTPRESRLVDIVCLPMSGCAAGAP
jgi:hypothetical protein